MDSPHVLYTAISELHTTTAKVNKTHREVGAGGGRGERELIITYVT